MLVLNVLKVVRRLMMGTDFFLTMEQISYSDSQSNLSLHIGQIREWIKGSHFSGSSYSIRVMKDAKKFNKEPDLAASRVSTLLCIVVSTATVTMMFIPDRALGESDVYLCTFSNVHYVLFFCAQNNQSILDVHCSC